MLKSSLSTKVHGFLYSVLLMSALNSPLAHAHAHLKKAEPAENSVTAKLPESVVLNFSEELEGAMSKIEVRDLGSKKIISEGKATAGSAADPNSLQIHLKPETEMGTGKSTSTRQFEVSWKAVAKDTHSTKGSYKFKLERK